MSENTGDSPASEQSASDTEAPGSDAMPASPRGQSPAGRRWLPDVSLVTKLVAMLLLTSLASVALIATIGYLNGRNELRQQSIDQLNSLKTAKKQQVEWYFRQLQESFKSFGEDITIISAISAFKDGFAQLGTQPLAAERKQKLIDLYTKDYLPLLATGSSGPDLQSLLPKTDRSLELQVLFLAENPNSRSRRADLADNPTSNAYTLAHYTFHPWFRDLISRYNFYDLFLIDGVTGEIVYSVSKEPEIGTSLLDGPYAGSRLGQLAQDIIKSPQRGTVSIADASFYRPSGNAPAMFIAAPVFSNWKFMGVVAAQISTEALTDFMTNNGSWRTDGLGETGELYLAGEDRLLRSQARGLIENKDAYLQMLQTSGLASATIDQIARQDTSILLQPADTEIVRKALQGADGVEEFVDYRGKTVLGSFDSLDIRGLHWTLVVKKDVEEALASQTTFARRVMLASLLLSLVVPLLATWLTRRFLKPVNVLLDGIERIRAGEKDVTIPARGNDEFGKLTAAFNGMAEAVRERDRTINSKSSAYESLLRHIFPEVVATRLKQGEAQFAETFPQTTVVFASVHGFVQAAEGAGSDSSIGLLNEIVDAFDIIAEECGVEKIKTIGEHYLAACGLSTPRLDHIQRSIEFADKIAIELDRISGEHGLDLKLRVAIDSGMVHAGLVGHRRFVYDIWGRPQNVARRMVHETGLNEIRLSEECYKALNGPEDFKPMERFDSKTLGPVQTYGRPLAIPDRKSAGARGARTKAAE